MIYLLHLVLSNIPRVGVKGCGEVMVVGIKGCGEVMLVVVEGCGEVMLVEGGGVVR